MAEENLWSFQRSEQQGQWSMQQLSERHLCLCICAASLPVQVCSQPVIVYLCAGMTDAVLARGGTCPTRDFTTSSLTLLLFKLSLTAHT